jgi:intracellular septation protein
LFYRRHPAAAGAPSRRFTYDTRPLLPSDIELMQLLLDFLPVLAFFITYKLSDIYVATAVIMAAMTLQCALLWFRNGKVSNMLLASTALVLVFGSVTLLVHDKAFIQWKMTILDGLFALAFLLAPYFGGQTLVQRLMGAQITLPPQHWRTLNWMWIIFFVVMGALNVYVIYTFDEATWVNFKMFGTLGLTLVFVILQGLWLSSKLPKDAAPEAKPTPPDQSN